MRHILALLGEGVPPDRMLVISFSRSAARTFRERLAPTTTKVPVRTFHSEAIHILSSPPISRHMDRLLSDSARTSLWHELLGPRTRYCPRAIGPMGDGVDPDAVSMAVEIARLAGRDPVSDETLPPAYRSAAKAFRLTKRDRRVVDYTDLIVMATEALEQSTEALTAHTPLALVVDEAQDTNATQMRLVELLAAGAKSTLVVGDPNQAIYGFQGADPSTISHFDVRFPNASIYTLRRTYRCSSAVAATANALMPHGTSSIQPTTSIRGLVGTVVHNQDYDEAPWVAAQVQKIQAARPGTTVLILARTNLDLEPMSASLRQARIEFVRLGGATGFWNLPEIDGMLDMARLAADPLDMISACRLATWPPRRHSTHTSMVRAILAEGGPPHGYRALADSPAAALRVEHLIVPSLRSTPTTHPGDLIGGVIDSQVWRKMTPPGSPTQRIGSTLSILSSIARQASSIESLLATALYDAGSQSQQQPAVILATAHGAKGMEADVVVVLGTEKGRWPHSKSVGSEAISEERRLLYVATTRARTMCVWSGCKMRDGKERAPSPFIADVQATVSVPTLSGDLADWMTWALSEASADT